jgi:hypothetical protein
MFGLDDRKDLCRFQRRIGTLSGMGRAAARGDRRMQIAAPNMRRLATTIGTS